MKFIILALLGSLLTAPAFARGKVVDFSSQCEGGATLTKYCSSTGRPCYFLLNGQIAHVETGFTYENLIFIRAWYRSDMSANAFIDCAHPSGRGGHFPLPSEHQ